MSKQVNYDKINNYSLKRICFVENGKIKVFRSFFACFKAKSVKWDNDFSIMVLRESLDR